MRSSGTARHFCKVSRVTWPQLWIPTYGCMIGLLVPGAQSSKQWCSSCTSMIKA